MAAQVFLQKNQNRLQLTNQSAKYNNRPFEVHHRDGNTANNYYKNLEYVTSIQNLICVHGETIVALYMKQPLYYWTQNSCCSAYGLSELTFIIKYLNKPLAFVHLGQSINFITWDCYDSNEKTVKRECIDNQDKRFQQFRKVLSNIINEQDDDKKTSYLIKYFKNGSNNVKFLGDKKLFCEILLPQIAKSAVDQKDLIINALARLTGNDLKTILKYLNNSSISRAYTHFFATSNTSIQPKC